MVDQISSENTERTVGRDAQRNNILAAKILAETVKTTLGPRGMDKMLVDTIGNVIVTNDGATILSEMEIEHPAAKMLVEVAKTQDKEVGDGTTTAVMLTGKLLENAERLLDQKIHPTIITRGYRLAAEKSQKILSELSAEINSEDDLLKIAQTAITGKGAEHIKGHLSEIMVKAIKTIANGKEIDLEDIKIEKKRGYSNEDSKLIEGIVIDKERVSIEMPKLVNDAKIALLDMPIEVRTPDRETRISISSPEQLQNFINSEDELLKSMVEKIVSSGANVVACQKGIDDVAQFYLMKREIYAIRRVSKTDLQRLAKATGGKIISNIRELTSDDLGKARQVEEVREDDEGMTYITGCENPKSLTILVRGGTSHVMDEIERALADGLGDLAVVMKEQKVVAGGGAIEIELARRIKEFAKTLKGREQLAVEQFALALEFIPTTLAENAGLDPLDVLVELKAVHEAGNRNHGLNLFSGKIEDTLGIGIIEPLRVKSQAISSASEVSIMILRIDDVIASKRPKQKMGNMAPMMDYD